jgi:hypothetical protein
MAGRAANFPPYDLLTQRAVQDTESKMARLERIYHVAQRNAWRGAEVLEELVARHGPPSIPEEKKQAIARVFTIILWGELAAWIVSADLAERLDDIEAKMAATSQAFDEARHFYVMRDYLLLLGVELPPLDGYTQAVLRELLSTKSLARKLIGMQLIVENVALGLFRAVARSRVEPVLSELMPYYERDEARHVGVGILYLPEMLAQASAWQDVRLKWFQFKIQTLVIWGTRLMKRDFAMLGIDLNKALREGVARQESTFSELTQVAHRRVRGVYQASDVMRRVNSVAIDLFFPPAGVAESGPQLRVNEALMEIARHAEHFLKRVT